MIIQSSQKKQQKEAQDAKATQEGEIINGQKIGMTKL